MNEKNKARKKICPGCGRKLWLKDYYRHADGTIFSRCKECTRKASNEKYGRRRKRNDGIIYDEERQRWMEHKGYSKHIYWSKDMTDYLKREFPTSTNEEIAGALGLGVRTVIRKARELNVEKDRGWLTGIWDQRRQWAHMASRRKGYPNGYTKKAAENA